MYLEDVYLFTGNEQVIKKNKMDRILSNLDPKETDIVTYDAEVTSIQEIKQNNNEIFTENMTINYSLSTYKIHQIQLFY